jgi:hypothetical protein
MKDATETSSIIECDEKAHKIPELVATGNEQIEILKHSLIYKEGKGRGVAVNLKNISEENIGKVIFKVVFYDTKGEIMEIIEPSIVDVEKDKKRLLSIESSKTAESDVVGYKVEIIGVSAVPLPVATGNDQLKVLKHYVRTNDNFRGASSSIVIVVRNVSKKTIASAVFDIIYYDYEGNMLERTRHREIEIDPDVSRSVEISINSNISKQVASYNITLLKTTTADVEKVQLRKSEIRTTEDGGEEVKITLKNISDIKTDIALIVKFTDSINEIIGTKVFLVKDVKPYSIKEFQFVFNPPEGELVRNYTLNIGEIMN